jgi:hypothetical protein
MRPIPPRGVRLVGDGINIHLDDRLVYEGRSADGIYNWRVDLDDWDWTEVLRGRRTVQVGMLPGHCSVSIGRRS